MSKHLAKFQSRLWRDVEAAHRYYRAEGFTVGKCRCRLCGDEDDGSVEPGADLARLGVWQVWRP